MTDISSVTAWCRMNDCYRTTQTNSQFCAKHGWNQNVEREPQTKHSAGDGTVAGNETPVSSTPAAGGSTSRSAQLTDHLHNQLLCLARWEAGRSYPCALPKGHAGRHEHPMDPMPEDHMLAVSA